MRGREKKSQEDKGQRVKYCKLYAFIAVAREHTAAGGRMLRPRA